MGIFNKSSRIHIHNIGFISTRIAGTDGVSLEIQKWAEVLERNRYNCFYFAGKLDRPKAQSYLVDEAFFEHPEVKEINEAVFGKRVRSPKISKKVDQLKHKLKAELYRFRDKFQIDLIIPENALAIPMNIPLGLAITEFIAETGIPTIAHHHDFAWERDRFLVNACEDYLHTAFPPNLPNIQHVVINSLASQQLSYRRGISNTIIPNVLDYLIGPPEGRIPCNEIREKIGLAPDDVFILQPTRVIPRKRIERSIEIVKAVNEALGKKNRVLVISHASGDEGDEYYRRIKEYAREVGVQLVHIDHLISENSGSESGGPSYSIADIYRCADLVTYPSGYEGFGNAFLEAIYFKKPVVVNRYSIYIVDIEPKNFDVIVMDEFVSPSVVQNIIQVLQDPVRQKEMVDHNYELAKKYFSYEVLEAKLLHLLKHYDQ